MRALVLADTHFHSYYGPWKRGSKVNGMRVDPNYVQEQLWDGFESIQDEDEFDFCILNGDIVEGYQKAEQGKLVIDNDLGEQCKYAAKMIADIVPTNKFYVTQGTPYHVGREVCADDYIAQLLEGKYDKEATYHHEQIVNADWARIHCSHNIGVSNGWYRTTAIARDVLLYEINKEEYGPIHLLVRSHAHYYVGVDFGHKGGIVTPCFQARTHYCSLKDIPSPPKIGYIVLDISDDEDNPVINIQKRFFKIDGMMPEEFV